MHLKSCDTTCTCTYFPLHGCCRHFYHIRKVFLFGITCSFNCQILKFPLPAINFLNHFSVLTKLINQLVMCTLGDIDTVSQAENHSVDTTHKCSEKRNWNLMKSILQNHYEPNFASEEARSEIHCQALAYTSSLT